MLKDFTPKPIAIIFFFICLFVFIKLSPSFPLSVNQVTTTKTDLFTVTGEGKVTAIPNTAQISLGFTANAATVGDVQNQANQIINKVSADVKKLGVEDKDIQTSSYNLRVLQDFPSRNPKITGYAIDANLAVKARDFSKINQIIDTATADGANQVGGLTFTLDDATQEKLTSQARKLAIDQAKQKASDIANEAGINLGRIIDVQENQPNRIMPMYAAGVAKADTATAPAPTQVEPGSSDITVNVTLSYETR